MVWDWLSKLGISILVKWSHALFKMRSRGFWKHMGVTVKNICFIKNFWALNIPKTWIRYFTFVAMFHPCIVIFVRSRLVYVTLLVIAWIKQTTKCFCFFTFWLIYHSNNHVKGYKVFFDEILHYKWHKNKIKSFDIKRTNKHSTMHINNNNERYNSSPVFDVFLLLT